MVNGKKNITVKEFLKLKLWEAILWVIEDVKNFRKAGIKIDMDDYYRRKNNGKICSVCLGGAAMLGFEHHFINDKNSYVGVKLVGCSEPSMARIADTFDQLRRGDIVYALKYWYNFDIIVVGTNFDYGDIDYFDGVLSGWQVKKLIQQLKEVSDNLKAKNL